MHSPLVQRVLIDHRGHARPWLGATPTDHRPWLFRRFVVEPTHLPMDQIKIGLNSPLRGPAIVFLLTFLIAHITATAACSIIGVTGWFSRSIAIGVAVFLAVQAFAIIATRAWNRTVRRTHDRGDRHPQEARFIDKMLEERRCPCCGYSLAKTKPGPQGFLTCPECNATWCFAPTAPG